MSDLRFLSEEWLAALGELVASLPSIAEEDAGGPAAPPLRLGQLVTGGPDGDLAYTLVIGGNDAGVVLGVDGAEVVLVESYATAKEMAAGEMTAGEALARGLVKVRGNANLLIGAAPLLAEVATAVAALGARTSF